LLSLTDELLLYYEGISDAEPGPHVTEFMEDLILVYQVILSKPQQQLTLPRTRIKVPESVPTEYCGKLADLKITGWKDRLKGRELEILDGKWTGQFCTFQCWSGTVCYVLLKGDGSKISLPVQRRVRIIHKEK
jgi:hypothetical protein